MRQPRRRARPGREPAGAHAGRRTRGMSPPLITVAQRAGLLVNGARSALGEHIDPPPVVKLFTPDAGATWLLTEPDPADPDRAFGLCDVGLGCPELGCVSLVELAGVRGCLGLPVARDRAFVADGPLSAYAERAQAQGRITV